MTRPLNDDGTIPKKRCLRLALQVVEGKDIVAEVHREVKPKWAPINPDEDVVAYDSSSEPQPTLEQLIEPLVQVLSEGAKPVVPEMMRELLLMMNSAAKGAR